jgi:ATP-binding cassette subfamily B protein
LRQAFASWRNLLRRQLLLLRTAYRASPGLAVVVFSGVVLIPIVSLARMYFASVLVAEVGRAVTGGAALSARGLRALVISAALFVAIQATTPLRGVAEEALARRVNQRARSRLMAAATRSASIAHLEMSSVLDDIDRGRGIGGGRFSPGVTVGALTASWGTSALGWSMIAPIAAFNVAIAALVIASVFATRAINRITIRRQVAASIEGTDGLRRGAYFRSLALTPTAAKETRVFGLADWIADRFRSATMTGLEYVLAERRRATRQGILLRWLPMVAAFVVAYVTLARAVINGAVSVEVGLLVAQAIQWSATLNMTWRNEFLLESAAASLNAIDSLERSPIDAELGDPPADAPAVAVRFEGVAFRYRDAAARVIDQLDLEVPAFQTTAIVGLNGAGKTTLVKLLARLYEPEAGRITVDGIDVTSWDPSQWQRKVAALFQDYTHYARTARENVTLGAAEHLDDAETAEQAAVLAGAASIAGSLPSGWETTLSPAYAGGVDVSGGQWQRFALARALFAVAHGATVLVLDEPTANLDVRAEAQLFDQLATITRRGVLGRRFTTILISHRFSSVRRADHIVVLDGGRVVERGSHEELLALGGRYARLFSLQAERFNEVAG